MGQVTTAAAPAAETRVNTFLARNLHFPIVDGVQSPQTADPQVVKGLGLTPVTMQFRLDNGSIIEVAAPGKMSALAQGPFFSDSSESK